MVKSFVLGAATILAMSACSRGTDPKSVVADFAGRLDSGSCSGLRDYVVAAQRESAGAASEQMCQLQAQVKQAGTPVSTTEVLDATEQGDTATVRTREREADGSTAGESTVKLVREGGVWKIDMASSL